MQKIKMSTLHWLLNASTRKTLIPFEFFGSVFSGRLAAILLSCYVANLWAQNVSSA